MEMAGVGIAMKEAFRSTCSFSKFLKPVHFQCWLVTVTLAPSRTRVQQLVPQPRCRPWAEGLANPGRRVLPSPASLQGRPRWLLCPECDPAGIRMCFGEKRGLC